MAGRTVVMWFRRDLRLADSPAIVAAAAEGPVLPLFVVDPRFTRAGAPRQVFLRGALDALDASTERSLVVRHGDPLAVVPAVAAEVGARIVVVAQDFAPYGRRRDDLVAARLAVEGCDLRRIGSPYAVEPGRVRKDDGTPYAVFTPFSRAWRGAGWDDAIDVPDVDWRGYPAVDCDGMPAVPALAVDLPPATETAAAERVEAFVADGAEEYHERRDEPALDGTSRLSPYLRFGLLHPRQVLAELGYGRGHETFRNELCWREFAADVLFHHPRSAWENLDRRMDRMPVDTGAVARERFAAWCVGRTGYPLVDAGIRQLLATGWMHNRVRMITASFLVKDLHLPWQWGARFFLAHLVDGDLASNNHGWQWAAGTGTDAAPYYRVFNPTTQAQRFDPDGVYVRRWLPEVDDRDYPEPIVDHRAEREEALRRYQSVKGRGR
jgi:deoxyribodipyrimidine photo-lyase